MVSLEFGDAINRRIFITVNDFGSLRLILIVKLSVLNNFHKWK